MNVCSIVIEAGTNYYTKNYKAFEKLTENAIKQTFGNKVSVKFVATDSRDKLEPDIELVPTKDADSNLTITIVYKTKNHIPISPELGLDTEEVRWFYISAIMFELSKIYIFIKNKSYRRKILKYVAKITAITTGIIGLPASIAIYSYVKSASKGSMLASALTGFLISAIIALAVLSDEDLTIRFASKELGCTDADAAVISSYKMMLKTLTRAYKTSYVEVRGQITNFNV